MLWPLMLTFACRSARRLDTPAHTRLDQGQMSTLLLASGNAGHTECVGALAYTYLDSQILCTPSLHLVQEGLCVQSGQ